MPKKYKQYYKAGGKTAGRGRNWFDGVEFDEDLQYGGKVKGYYNGGEVESKRSKLGSGSEAIPWKKSLKKKGVFTPKGKLGDSPVNLATMFKPKKKVKTEKSNWWGRFKKRYTDYGTQQKQMRLQATGTPKEKAAATKSIEKRQLKMNPENVVVQKAGAKKGHKVTPGTTPKKMVKTKGAGAEAEYPQFEKGTYRVKSFKTAFREARKAGKTQFSWAPEGGKSRRYSTKMK